jgi:hypothetical protein
LEKKITLKTKGWGEAPIKESLGGLKKSASYTNIQLDRRTSAGSKNIGLNFLNFQRGKYQPEPHDDADEAKNKAHYLRQIIIPYADGSRSDSMYRLCASKWAILYVSINSRRWRTSNACSSVDELLAFELKVADSLRELPAQLSGEDSLGGGCGNWR